MSFVLHRWAVHALDLVLPPRCPSCGSATEAGHHNLCPECWRNLDLLGPPWCACCGLPFPVSALDGSLCAACLKRHPHFARARAALSYDDASRRLVLRFKYADETHTVRALAALMVRAGGDLLNDADLLVPVPLHRLRLWRRRFNQAALLSLALSRRSGVPVTNDLLIRVRATPTQTGLKVDQRHTNVRGAFAVRSGLEDAVQGKRVLLIDDVYTTGATVGECARTLIKSGASAVDVLTVARVVRPGRG